MSFTTTLVLAVLLPLLPSHEYHISKTNLRYVEETEQVQVEIHVFAEDLEKDMVAYGAPEDLELGTEIQHPDAEALLERYLGEHFEINWNDMPLSLTVVGYELEDDLHGLWIYLSAEKVSAPDSVRVYNSLMVETFTDQQNIVKIYRGEERGATLLMNKARTEGVYVAK